jgi:hypothetical protein
MQFTGQISPNPTLKRDRKSAPPLNFTLGLDMKQPNNRGQTTNKYSEII